MTPDPSTVAKWFALDVLVEYGAAGAVESAFNALGSLGSEINNLSPDGNRDVTVTGYFDEAPDAAAARETVDQYLRIYGFEAGVRFEVRERVVANEDWLAEWKRHWSPTTAGRFIIAPPWSDVVAGDKIVIRIEPNMAFGTGTHETTKLCLKAIGRLHRPGGSFLDVGTGTGVLAIAAAKLSDEGDIAAYETDGDSVAIARENAVANGVGGRIEFFHATISNETPAADLICANLTLDVIVPILPLLVSKSKQFLVLSGILKEQQTLMTDQLTDVGINDPLIETDGEWISVTVSRV